MTNIKPTSTPPVAKSKKQDRQERLAQALRQNLLKRKQQQRARETEAREIEEPAESSLTSRE